MWEEADFELFRVYLFCIVLESLAGGILFEKSSTRHHHPKTTRAAEKLF